MEMHQIRYFLTVCETGNFTRAAELCNVSQPALTTAIKKLEDDLGGPLFHRERGRVSETGLGTLMRPRLEHIWQETHAALNDADNYHRLHKVPMKLGVMVTVGPTRLSGLLASYKAKHPSVEVEVHEGGLEDLIGRLDSGEFELAVFNQPGVPDSRLNLTPLYAERYMVLYPQGHRFEGRDGVGLDDLNGEPYVDRLACEMRDIVMATCAERKVELYATFRSVREDWIQGMVMAGLGFAFMPENSILYPQIPRVPLTDPPVERTVSLANVAGGRGLHPHGPGPRLERLSTRTGIASAIVVA